MTHFLAVMLSVLGIGHSVILPPTTIATSTPAATSTALYQQIELATSTCVGNQALPDPSCTPGAVLTTDASVVCVSGYSPKVRDVSVATKEKVFAEYGIPYSEHTGYEVDHFISLELGGSNDISNLWPEAHDITNGSFVKDKLENHLHAEVCSGSLSLTQAQQEISGDWMKYYAIWKGATSTASSVIPTTVPTPVPTPIIPAYAVPVVVATPLPSTTTQGLVPVGATAQCGDGTYSYSKTHSGTCSRHGGVAQWYQ